MSRTECLRRAGDLVRTARCPCIGATGLATDGRWLSGWFATPQVAGFPEPPASHRRHYSRRPGVDDTAAPASHSQVPSAIIDDTTAPALRELVPSLAAHWPAPPPAASGLAATAAAETVPRVTGPAIAAASPLEDSLALVLSPTQLGVQLWEGAHSLTGLPWWAAIPTATLALRGALLPLSLRAYAASANVALLQQAFVLSGTVAEAAEAAAKQRRPLQEGRNQQQQQQQQQSEAGSEGPGSGRVAGDTQRQEDRGGSRGPSEAGGAAVSSSSSEAVELGRLDLLRRVFAHLRSQHRPPSFGWYLGNTVVQGAVLGSCSLALRRMSDSLWPGLTSEGLLYFKDLTAPPMYLQTLSTPYGTAGAILPLALVLLYVSATDRSAGGSSPGINMALKLLVLPLYCMALLQPHAVLLYWLTQVVTQLGVYTLAAEAPGRGRAAGAPEVPVEGRAGSSDAGALDDLLLALSESYKASGNLAAARTCLQTLLARRPDHAAAAEQLRALGDPAGGNAVGGPK